MIKHTYMWVPHICEDKKKEQYFPATTPPPRPALFGHEEMQTGQSVHFLPAPWPVQTSGQKGPLSRWDRDIKSPQTALDLSHFSPKGKRCAHKDITAVLL